MKAIPILIISAFVLALLVAVPATSEASTKTKAAWIAKKELRKRVSETRGNNVPRYRNGRGSIAPYNIRDEWCVTFIDWSFRKAGNTSLRAVNHQWRSSGGARLAVSVSALTKWAKQTGRFSKRSKSVGDIVIYKYSHVGIITTVRKGGRLVTSIEGNKKNRIKRVRVNQRKVLGYVRM